MTLQLVRPDSTQSCILLAALSSCANHRPTTNSTTAIASPAIAGGLLSRGSRFCGLGFTGPGFAGSRFSVVESFMNRTFFFLGLGLPLRSIESAAPPGNGRPNPFVKIIPCDLRDDLHAGNRARDFDPPGKKPADREGVEGSKGSPTDGLEDRS